MKKLYTKLYGWIVILLVLVLSNVLYAQDVKLSKDSLATISKYWGFRNVLWSSSDILYISYVDFSGNLNNYHIEEVGGGNIIDLSSISDVKIHNSKIYAIGTFNDSISSGRLYNLYIIDPHKKSIDTIIPLVGLCANKIIFVGDTVYIGGTSGNYGWPDGGIPAAYRYSNGSLEFIQYQGTIRCRYSSLLKVNPNGDCIFYMHDPVGGLSFGDIMICVNPKNTKDTVWCRQNMYFTDGQNSNSLIAQIGENVFYFEPPGSGNAPYNGILMVDSDGNYKRIFTNFAVSDMIVSNGYLWVSGANYANMASYIAIISPEGDIVGSRNILNFHGGFKMAQISDGSFFFAGQRRDDITNGNIVNYFARYTQTPSEPQLVKVDTVDSGVSISWQKPILCGGKPITSYKVEYRKDSDVVWKSVSTTALNFKFNFQSKSAIDQDYVFRVRAMNEAGAGIPSETISVVVPQSPTGVYEIGATSFNVYPNPASVSEIITIDGIPNDIEIYVYDILGVEVLRTTTSKFFLSKSGIYMIRVGDSRQFKKIIVN